MNAHLSIPFEVRFFSEMFKLPSLGKFISNIKKNTKDQYAFVSYALIGLKEELVKNHIKTAESDIKDLNKIKNLLSFVSNAIGDNDNQHLVEIKKSVLESLETIDEIVKIIEDKLAYKRLKQNLYNASSRAATSHLAKYSEAI